MPRQSPKTKDLARAIAMKRVAGLISLSEKALRDGNQALSRRYAELASKIQSHYRIRPSLRYRVCKNCGSILVPGITSSTRLSSSRGYMVVKCMVCGTELHKVYKK
jgi:RNase P subunit RPR2